MLTLLIPAPRLLLPMIALVSIGLLIDSNHATAQTPGEIAAAAIRNRAANGGAAVRNNIVQRGFGLPVARGFYPQSNYRTRRPAYNYGYGGYGYPNYGYGYGYSNHGYGGYGYGGYGYGGYGHGGYGPTFYRFGNADGSSTLGNRLKTPGSNYFGPPHASQYIPNQPR